MSVQRRLEQELQRSQQLDLVGRLAGGIAHDFNNLLTVVLSMAELAGRKLPADHAVRQDLGQIQDAAGQAAQLAGQLLAFSKQRNVRLKPVDVGHAARRALDLLRATLPLRIQAELAVPEEALHVQADETQLQQVLMNLCLNARDAMPQGGKLCVQVDPAARDGAAPASWVRLSVRDTGHGMSAGVRAHIFDPFYSTKEHGTGLGLAVVQQIVASYGGRIDVHSEPGSGSRFDVWLPRC